MSNALPYFGPATRAWFSNSFKGATRIQREGWPIIKSGQHALLFAPTGSGKTLASFLSCLDDLAHDLSVAESQKERKLQGYRAVYVSPLKALVYDIDRNLKAPLVGIENAAAKEGIETRAIVVDVRTGDTSQKERARQKRSPGDVLVTTPESLYLLLTSGARENFRSVQTIILDEIHTLAGQKRGVHLALSMERLSAICESEPQRIGLSATQRPLERIARFLGGDREVKICDCSEAPHLDLEIAVPTEDMERPKAPQSLEPLASGGPLFAKEKEAAGLTDTRVVQYASPTQAPGGMWPAIYAELFALIKSHTSTIVFTNSRLSCEKIAKHLNEMAGEEIVFTHHGSLSHERRSVIEEALKSGTIPALVATSSLELGIDMGAVDLVCCVESPGSVASGLQRVGRAGHSVGEQSVGKIFPKFRGDLLECTVVAARMLKGQVEETHVPQNCLDVLAQHIVAMVAMDDYQAPDLLKKVRRTSPFANLTPALFESVLDMLSGRYPSDGFADLSPRINYDRSENRLEARKSARLTSVLNAGTITDRGMYRVHLGEEGGARLGELDEEMVYETREGDTIILGASTWRVNKITRDRVFVTPAPGEPGRLPFWKGEKPGRPIELGREMGKFLRDLSAQKPKKREKFVTDYAPLSKQAANNLIRYIDDQREATGSLPTDIDITIERFRDELGDWRVCILTPFGAKVHAPWALALEKRLADDAGYEVQVMHSDDGLCLRFADNEDTPNIERLLLDPDDVEEQLTDALNNSALFASHFRMNASRALLLPRKRADGRQPLWLQRRRSQTLLAVAQQYPAFPIVLETYRECLQDIFDVPALKDVLTKIRAREIRIHECETKSASPFARSLAFQYVASYLYDGDAPLAERKAHSLTLDKSLLRELLGEEALRELLDEEAVFNIGQQLQRLEKGRQARGMDPLLDMLRRLGDLSENEIEERCEGDAKAWLSELETKRLVIPVRIRDEVRYLNSLDAGRYLEALGVALPPGLPAVYRESPEEPLLSIFLRYAKTHAPFKASCLAERYDLLPKNVITLLNVLKERGELEYGEITPGAAGSEWVHIDVLRRIKRASLAKLRKDVQSVDDEVFARFLPGWQNVAPIRLNQGRYVSKKRASLEDVLEQLEGCALPFSDWIDAVLPARVENFRKEDLDTLSAMGKFVWIGRSALGPKDGRISIVRRDRVGLLFDYDADANVKNEEEDALDEVQKALLKKLEERGACFFFELQSAVENASTDEVMNALWDLAFKGRLTNDTFQPLRGLSSRGSKRRGAHLKSVGGRWSLVSDIIRQSEVSDTQKLHARSMSLLMRYGVLSRDSVMSEKVPGGFSAFYPLLRALEEGGKARRGHFVWSLSGAQFAMPGALDRLRAKREVEALEFLWLATCDPANPYGAQLAWPEHDCRPKRIAGARVLLVNGHCALYVERGGKSVILFEGEYAGVALEFLAKSGVKGRGDVRKINGVAALSFEGVEDFVKAGFERDYKGLSLPVR